MADHPNTFTFKPTTQFNQINNQRVDREIIFPMALLNNNEILSDDNGELISTFMINYTVHLIPNTVGLTGRS